jgi:hypothetical protein
MAFLRNRFGIDQNLPLKATLAKVSRRIKR